MTIETRRITINGLPVEVVRKAIKNLHLAVYPPHGRVRVAAPLAFSDDAVRLAVVCRLGWIKRQRAKFQSQLRQSQREMVRGESHYFLGRRYRLRIIEHAGAGRIALRNASIMDMYLRPGTSAKQREKILLRWYREQLKAQISPLLEKWQPALGVQLTGWGIKRMKTKWGTCNAEARRIWLNLELAKRPVQCLEYIVVHELAHLLERHHNDRFTAILDQCLPHWRMLRQELGAGPLAHEAWMK